MFDERRRVDPGNRSRQLGAIRRFDEAGFDRLIGVRFNAADRDEAIRRLALAVKKYAKSSPKLADWMETNLPERQGRSRGGFTDQKLLCPVQR